MQRNDLNIGVHLSLGNDPRASVAAARAQGASCLQIFASSPGAWKPPVLRELRVDALRDETASSNVAPLVIHAIYLINLASADEGLRRRSVHSLKATLEAGAAMGALGVVTHLGSHGGRGFEAVADVVGAELREILQRSPADVALMLENSAGAGGLLGAPLEELAVLIERAGGDDRLKVALDTAHLCGAGWDLAADGEAARLVASVESTFGLDRLAVLHANDSKVPPASRRDRHAIVGEGHIGYAGFTRLMEQPELRRVPWLLETPDLDTTLPEDERWISLRRLRELDHSMDTAGAP